MQGTGATIAKIAIMANLYNNNFQERSTDNTYNADAKSILKKGSDLSINMSIEERKPAVFACIDEIIESLGISEMKNPIPVGIIEMTNELVFQYIRCFIYFWSRYCPC